MEILSIAKEEEKATFMQIVALLSHPCASVRIKLTLQQLSSVPAEIIHHVF